MLDPDTLIDDLQDFVACPSVTGNERAMAELFAERAEDLGLEAEVVSFDLDLLRAHPGYPGEEAPRTELVAAIATRRGADPYGPRIAFDGHIDVVPEGTEEWSHGPWSGDRDGGFTNFVVDPTRVD